MKIAVAIPTFQRPKKLKRLLDSLETQTYKDFHVIIFYDNNDHETCSYIKTLHYNFYISHVINDKQEFVIGSWNKVFKEIVNKHDFVGNFVFDCVQWLVDDVELTPNFLEQAVACLKAYYPDTDGVIGTAQLCPGREDYTFKWYGQPLIGRKFIERYKDVDYKVCCPQYSHFFQDEEMWLYAKSLNKFENCEEAVLYHYHPAFKPEEMDSTHPIVRGKLMRQDRAIFDERQKRGLIWGKSWELIKI